MNILIVIPTSNYTPTLPLGPLSIATYLNSHNHHAVLCDCSVERGSYKKYLQKDNLPGLAAFSLMASSSLKQARKISEEFRKAGVPTVWGGGYIAAHYDAILDSGYTDFVSLGDGELSLTQLADTLECAGDLSDVRGLVYKKNGSTVRNKSALLSGDEFPQFDLTLTDPRKYTQPFFCTKRMVHLYLSKGCPFKCSFCNRELVGDSAYRTKNTEYVINEIKYLVSECDCDGIYFYDELWCINKKAAYEFCDRLDKEKLDFKFGCYARIGQYDRQTLQRLYDSGCRWILFGIESGSPRLRESVNKYLNNDEIYATFEACHQIGIITQASFIVGLPGETEADLKETVAMAFALHADLLPFTVYTPVRGSELFDRLVSEKKIEPMTAPDKLEKTPFPYEKIEVNFTDVPKKELEVVRAFFRWCGFSSKTSNNMSKFEIAQEMIKRYSSVIFSSGTINISGVTEAFTVFNNVVFNILFHPMIRRKYGLYKKNFKYKHK